MSIVKCKNGNGFGFSLFNVIEAVAKNMVSFMEQNNIL